MRSKDAWQEQFRQAMLDRRTALQRALRSSLKPGGQDAASQVHMADVLDKASGDAADAVAAGLAEIESGQLVQIEEALRRLDEGTYGQCADCARPIPKARLQMVPFALRCVDCQQRREGIRVFRR